MKKIKVLFTVIGVITFVLLCFLFISPKPIMTLIKTRTPSMPGYSAPSNFAVIEKLSRSHSNVPYQSNYSNSTYDLYIPKGKKHPPIVVFFHGGGFITGDKEMGKYLGPTLAAQGYAVLSVNYDLSVGTTLNKQILQVTDFFNLLPAIAKTYGLNKDIVFLSGSSAGAYLALQLCSAKYHADYEIESQKVNSKVPIKGMILFSSPYDLSFIQGYPVKNLLLKLGIFEIGWSLTGNRFWKSDTTLSEKYDLTQYISPNFPPFFISDGNYKTFTKQAKNYSSLLIKNHVETTTLFFDKKDRVGHGYQMNMKTKESQQAIKAVLQFLAKHDD